MKHILTILSFALLFSWGCHQPAQVELMPQDPDQELEITSAVVADTSRQYAAVDSMGVLPKDQVLFDGTLGVSKITFDAGRTIQTMVLSNVFFADRARPVESPMFPGRRIGYFGFDLGPIMLNGSLMSKIPHRISLGIVQRDTTAGVEYIRDLTSSYLPRSTYTWSSAVMMGSFSPTIESPEDLNVVWPKGGAVVPRGQDLVLRWTGRGNLTVIVSLFEQGRTKPLLSVTPAINRGHATLSPIVLQSLRGGRTYVFTFVLYNRKELLAVNPFAGKVLVQAASIYNSYVELR
jgi:hypothetical protein